jgi:hypothetical protein
LLLLNQHWLLQVHYDSLQIALAKAKIYTAVV